MILTAPSQPVTSRCNATRCGLMDKLISVVSDSGEQSNNSWMQKDLAHYIAHQVVDDFSVKIFPTSNQDPEYLEESISSPFFVLCRSAFSTSKTDASIKPMSLLANVSKFFGAAGFLILYFLRGKFLMRFLLIGDTFEFSI